MRQHPIPKEFKERVVESLDARVLLAAGKSEEIQQAPDPLFRFLLAGWKMDPPSARPWPRYHKAIIDDTDQIRVNMWTGSAEADYQRAVAVCSRLELVQNLQRLVDALQLTRFEAETVIAKLHAVIIADDREGQANLAHERLPGVKPRRTRH